MYLVWKSDDFCRHRDLERSARIDAELANIIPTSRIHDIGSDLHRDGFSSATGQRLIAFGRAEFPYELSHK